MNEDKCIVSETVSFCEKHEWVLFFLQIHWFLKDTKTPHSCQPNTWCETTESLILLYTVETHIESVCVCHEHKIQKMKPSGRMMMFVLQRAALLHRSESQQWIRTPGSSCCWQWRDVAQPLVRTIPRAARERQNIIHILTGSVCKGPGEEL